MPATMCCVPLCKNRGGHRFPFDPYIRERWLIAIRRNERKSASLEGWSPSKHSVVCTGHFTQTDYSTETFHGTIPARHCLKRTAVPSIFQWKQINYNSLERQERAQTREAKREVKPDIHDIQQEVEVLMSVTSGHHSIAALCEDDEVVADICRIEQGTQTFLCPQMPPICIERYQDKDKIIHMYTGLESYHKFQFVFQSLGPAVAFLEYRGEKPNISIENQFFMTLIYLRMHKSQEELAVNFETSINTVSSVLRTWINFMYFQWQEIDIWPSQELVRYYIPFDFRKKFPKTRIILDGMEIPIQKPAKSVAQQVTYSTYKNRNTLKVIVGGTPGGLISSIPPAYGGSASDRALVERSPLIRHLDPKDEVMVDKGFKIQDILAPYDVKLSIPTFLVKRNQFHTLTRTSDKKIASKRVHIERLIGLAKTYKILTQPLVPHEIGMGSQIAFCCLMLCNFRECIVPLTA